MGVDCGICASIVLLITVRTGQREARVRMVSGVSALAVTLTALALAAPAGASAGSAAAAAGAPAGASASGSPAVLATGKCLIASRNSLSARASRESRSGVFTLIVTSQSVQLWEDETFPDGFSAGTEDWRQFPYPSSGPLSSDKSTFCMRASGSLVLSTSKGKVIWSSHTAGTGRHNYLRVENDGNLVVYTGRGKAVWASGTTRSIMIAGTTLRSGAHLVYRELPQLGITPTWLIMRRSGDLVLQRGSDVIWSTRTHVKGARAALLRDGNFVVYSPDGRVLWQSHTRGHDAFLELNCSYLGMSYRTRGTSWNAPAGRQPLC
jgi:hypothetical protein